MKLDLGLIGAIKLALEQIGAIKIALEQIGAMKLDQNHEYSTLPYWNLAMTKKEW